VIRDLAADELVWFMRQALTFAGHADPGGLALKLQARLKHPGHDASTSYVLFRDGLGVAGANLKEESSHGAASSLMFSSVWYVDAPEALVELVTDLLGRHPHEVATVPLHLLAEDTCAALADLLGPLGFVRERHARLRFALSEVPPLGTPLVLEAYRQEDEHAFREMYQHAEQRRADAAYWAYLKRKGGRFTPDHWFLARETLDQEPVGYAFCSRLDRGVDAHFTLDGAGVLPQFRENSEMLRRLVLSLLHELSGASPLGTVEAKLADSDPKLIHILGSLGFELMEHVPLLIKRPN
jgi:hypothetical protein